MAVGNNRQPPPPIWPHPRTDPVFSPLLQVELYTEDGWKVSVPALLALTDPLDVMPLGPAGRYRLTFPAAQTIVLLGRARGDPSKTRLGGQPLPLVWLGLDSQPRTPTHPLAAPRGWHPFTVRIPDGGVLELRPNGLRISQLLARKGVP